MKNLVFESSEYLSLLIPTTILFIFIVAAWLLKLWKRPAPSFGSKYPVVGTTILWFSVILMTTLTIIALARPKSEENLVLQKGSVDVIVALDKSLSMRANDIQPTRLDIAKRELEQLITKNILKPGDRIAFFRFGILAHATNPPTNDFDAFYRSLHATSFCPPLDETHWGTDIRIVLEQIYEILGEWEKHESWWDKRAKLNRTSPRIVFLAGDGNNDLEAESDSILNNAITELKKQNIKIYSIGVGTRTGVSWISLLGRRQDDDCEIVIDSIPPFYIKDWENETTRLERQTFAQLSQQTGGELFTIETENASALSFLESNVEKNRPSTYVLQEREGDNQLWWFIVLAALCIAAITILVYPFQKDS